MKELSNYQVKRFSSIGFREDEKRTVHIALHRIGNHIGDSLSQLGWTIRWERARARERERESERKKEKRREDRGEPRERKEIFLFLFHLLSLLFLFFLYGIIFFSHFFLPEMSLKWFISDRMAWSTLSNITAQTFSFVIMTAMRSTSKSQRLNVKVPLNEIERIYFLGNFSEFSLFCKAVSSLFTNRYGKSFSLSDPKKENWKDVIPHHPNVRINAVQKKTHTHDGEWWRHHDLPVLSVSSDGNVFRVFSDFGTKRRTAANSRNSA